MGNRDIEYNQVFGRFPNQERSGMDDMVVKGKKEDEGKISYEIDWCFLKAMAQRMDKNKGKYAPYNWKKPMEVAKLNQALARHFVEYMRGRLEDDGDSLGHLIALSCNAMMIWRQLMGIETGEGD